MTHASAIGVRAYGKALAYLAPRLASRAQGIDLSPMFETITPENYARSIPSLVNAIVQATDGCLAFDASTTELTQQLESIAPQQRISVPTGGYSEETIQKVLEILRPRITSSELLAAEKILRSNGAKPAAQPATSVMGEDAGGPARFSNDPRARQAFLDRFPEAALLKVEPTYKGMPPRAPTPVRNDPSVPSFESRFPEAKRIRHV